MLGALGCRVRRLAPFPALARLTLAVLVGGAQVAAAQQQPAQVDGARQQLRSAQAALLPLAVALLAELDWAETGHVLPVEGRISSLFGWRNISVNGNRFHAGVDLAAATGTPVRAFRSGRVERAGWWGTYGYAVVLDHGDGTESRYAHLSRYAVEAGDIVRQGDFLGEVGSTGASTGPHLHFELRVEGVAVDPLPYLQGDR